MTKKSIRLLGAAFWLSCLVLGGGWLVASSRDGAKPLISSVWTPTDSVILSDPTLSLSVGDAAFAKDSGADTWHQVGHVLRVNPEAKTVTLSLYEPFDLERETQFWDPDQSISATLHRSSGKVDDVIATLLPKPKREQLAQKISAAMRAHGKEISEAMLPLVFETVRQSLPVIESELSASLKRHDAEVEAIAARFREDIIQEQMVPLVRTEVLPVLRLHGREPAESIGREIWGKASLWRFGWRALYDSAPLPERELVREEWSRFVEQEVVPIVEDHLDEIAEAVEAILRDLAANEVLRERLGDVALQIVNDDEARDLLRTIVMEAIVDNERLRQVWVNVWTSPEAREKLRTAGERLEPVIREIGDEVMGTRREGIEPGFARVLRNQILGKDKVWITLKNEPNLGADPSQPIALRVATDFTPYPIVHLASPE
ncbi:MAG TPA: hypothetical protein DDX19_01465 [Rhodopirellula baltica]|uniref:Uncharacterized protein n=1 Tax=Rhodopirellula baltica (strain DSM 10527 / NCIMB 13988 / SH1) TaxID=243090 RepID=Q7UXV8_RHOBA|nr:hypothetical protein [Rhodopirellula baltica]CAD71893.1 hypothetical protein RB1077 [Rhodopirellula baltica SH 1]HBE61446.1 hypothetical protein [Rhodopirellula baltica]